jgi:hypothetical protein
LAELDESIQRFSLRRPLPPSHSPTDGRSREDRSSVSSIALPSSSPQDNNNAPTVGRNLTSAEPRSDASQDDNSDASSDSSSTSSADPGIPKAVSLAYRFLQLCLYCLVKASTHALNTFVGRLLKHYYTLFFGILILIIAAIILLILGFHGVVLFWGYLKHIVFTTLAG